MAHTAPPATAAQAERDNAKTLHNARVPDPRTAKPYSRAPNETSMVTKCSSVNLSTRPLGCSRPERTPAAPGRRRSSPQRCPGSTATPRRRHNSTWSRPLVFEWPTWRGFSRRRRRLGGVWEGLPATAVSPSDWTWLGELRADGGVADFFKTRAWESYQGAQVSFPDVGGPGPRPSDLQLFTRMRIGLHVHVSQACM